MIKRVLVTGSSRGIGRAIALRLAGDGYEIMCHGKSQSEKLDETLAALGDVGGENSKSHKKIIFDVSARAECKALLEEDVSLNGAYYGIVLSAGVNKDVPFPGMSDNDWDSILDIDLGGFYNVLKPLIMPMIKLRTGGRIVPITSISGIVGNKGQVNYSAAKAGLIGAAKSLSKELATRRITVNCVAPGGVETDMIDEKIREEMLKVIPMGRLARTDEIASSVSYLFSTGAEYMTGQTLILNGGMF